jgi:protein gp37
MLYWDNKQQLLVKYGMANSSKIGWTEATWNPVTGCSKKSDGCKNCYAERMAHRLKLTGTAHYKNGFEVTEHHDSLSVPLKWKKTKTIFVCSMSDLFHDKVSKEFILKVFDVMNTAHWHKFLVLTKRPERLLELNKELPWSPNIIMGVTVESDKYTSRIDLLKKCGAKARFLSLEPLISPILKLDLSGIDWVIVGGESGRYARPMPEEWVLDIREQCKAQKVPFFFEQWSGFNKHNRGNLLQGQVCQEYPAMLKPDTLF